MAKDFGLKLALKSGLESSSTPELADIVETASVSTNGLPWFV